MQCHKLASPATSKSGVPQPFDNPPQPVKPPLTSSPASCSRRKVTALACRSYPANTRSRSSAREEKQANEWSEGKQLQCLGVQVQAVAGKQAQQVLCKGRNKGARCFQI